MLLLLRTAAAFLPAHWDEISARRFYGSWNPLRFYGAPARKPHSSSINYAWAALSPPFPFAVSFSLTADLSHRKHIKHKPEISVNLWQRNWRQHTHWHRDTMEMNIHEADNYCGSTSFPTFCGSSEQMRLGKGFFWCWSGCRELWCATKGRLLVKTLQCRSEFSPDWRIVWRFGFCNWKCGNKVCNNLYGSKSFTFHRLLRNWRTE